MSYFDKIDSPYVWAGSAAAVAFVGLSLWQSTETSRAPGPLGLPFIGNVLSLSTKSPGPFVYFEQLAKKHGQCLY
jgi:hypothetical protein